MVVLIDILIGQKSELVGLTADITIKELSVIIVPMRWPFPVAYSLHLLLKMAGQLVSQYISENSLGVIIMSSIRCPFALIFI